MEKGGPKDIMPEKHLVCKGPSAVVGYTHPIFANSAVSHISVQDQLLDPPLDETSLRANKWTFL